MTVVRCDNTNCIHNERKTCDLDRLKIENMRCANFKPDSWEFYEEDCEEV
ncbi:MAG: DUF1540 domain-containing protein [Candidatus Thorarchaeota archaeon]